MNLQHWCDDVPVPASVGHLGLVPVVGEETILQDKPALLVALDIVGPLVQPALINTQFISEIFVYYAIPFPRYGRSGSGTTKWHNKNKESTGKQCRHWTDQLDVQYDSKTQAVSRSQNYTSSPAKLF